MLEAMRKLALDFLHDKLGGRADETPEVFYNRIRNKRTGSNCSPF